MLLTDAENFCLLIQASYPFQWRGRFSGVVGWLRLSAFGQPNSTIQLVYRHDPAIPWPLT